MLQAECQGVEDEEGGGGEGDDDDEGGCVAEYDGLLLECAGSVLGPLAGVVGGATILPRLVNIIQLLQNKLVRNTMYADANVSWLLCKGVVILKRLFSPVNLHYTLHVYWSIGIR